MKNGDDRGREEGLLERAQEWRDGRRQFNSPDGIGNGERGRGKEEGVGIKKTVGGKHIALSL